LPLYIYANQKPQPGSASGLNGSFYLPNSQTGFSRSIHTVLGYDYTVNPSLFLRIESYYQRQYRVPVLPYSSSFSLLNQGTSFTRYFPDALVNTGTGNNYGIEFTLSKSFSKRWYGLSTLSLYESNYTGSDGVNRPTDLNGQYIISNYENLSDSRFADYVICQFNLKATNQGPEDVYVTGGFNNYQKTATNRMKYIPSLGIYQADMMIKKGIYNYRFETKNPSDYLEGNYAQTENQYDILVYFRKPGTRIDALIGFQRINSIR
jgi:hypothetical protein